jgi:hypothetical protein
MLTKLIVLICRIAWRCAERRSGFADGVIDSERIDERIRQRGARGLILESQTLTWRSIDAKVVMGVESGRFQPNGSSSLILKRKAGISTWDWTGLIEVCAVFEGWHGICVAGHR